MSSIRDRLKARREEVKQLATAVLDNVDGLTATAKRAPTSAASDQQPFEKKARLESHSTEEDVKPSTSASTATTISEKSTTSSQDDTTTSAVLPGKEQKKELLRSATGNKPISKAAENIEALLSAPSAKEKKTQKMTAEILDLLNKPTAKELALQERFKSDGSTMREFCKAGTKDDCAKVDLPEFSTWSPGALFGKLQVGLTVKYCSKKLWETQNNYQYNVELMTGTKKHNFQASSTGVSCNLLHWRKIIQKHTDTSLGDCSFLNTCFHMDQCKYIHYEVDYSTLRSSQSGRKRHSSGGATSQSSGSGQSGRPTETFLESATLSTLKMYPPQWIQCDLRFFSLPVLGKCAVVMADPPWDIHMELPYGTMSDDEMRALNVQCLQDEGLIFLWVTGRAMELGRECLKLWGYRQCDELIWVKTNQLQRIIRTGRTGHWLNHGKEHCLVGIKGASDKYHALDCDVIVGEVRATSHKPDEVYGIIERLSPGTRKVELFGRQHNVQPNWITLGNQLDGVRLVDPEIVSGFQEKYVDGNCMPKPEDIIRYKQKQQQNQLNMRGRGGRMRM